MHWLYWDENSPAQLEAAGFTYDSTGGFNGAVGYRAGTTQAFKPPMARRILELPLHVMDTALFYPYHMNLTQSEAWNVMLPSWSMSNRTGARLRSIGMTGASLLKDCGAIFISNAASAGNQPPMVFNCNAGRLLVSKKKSGGF
jgi:hypothetical protein